MAASNYSTLMVDGLGNPLHRFKSTCGVFVQIYKDFVDVFDCKAWRNTTGWKNHMVMRVTEGRLDYQDVSLAVRRGPQEGIYAAVWIGSWINFPVGFVGYGVEAHDARGRWVGATRRSVAWFARILRDEKLFPGVPDFLRSDLVRKSMCELSDKIRMNRAVRKVNSEAHGRGPVGELIITRRGS